MNTISMYFNVARGLQSQVILPQVVLTQTTTVYCRILPTLDHHV